jgi:hypothetical protein
MLGPCRCNHITDAITTVEAKEELRWRAGQCAAI